MDLVRTSLAEDDATCLRGLAIPVLTTREPLSLYKIASQSEGVRVDGENVAFEGNYIPYYHPNSTEIHVVDLKAQIPSQTQNVIGRLNDGQPSTRCLDEYFTLGSLCPGPPPHTFNPESSIEQNYGPQQIDLVYAYVNGSDPLHQYYHHKAKKMGGASDSVLVAPRNKGPNILREFDELRFSLRSVLKHFRGSAKGVTVVASEYPFPGCRSSSEAGNWTLGQLPQWLDTSKGATSWMDGGIGLRMVHHSTAFGASYNSELPIFNSLAIESRLASLPDISDTFVYMNDDIFFNRPLQTYDFYRPYQRFGSRSRPYLTHTAKTLSQRILGEIASIWSEELGRTAKHQFRAVHRRDDNVEYDVSTTYLMTHYTVERWREALLWSFIVGRIGGDDDEWGQEQTNRVSQELGTKLDGDGPTTVMRGWRETLLKIGNEGIMTGEATKILFSSFDGYPYSNMGRSGFDQLPDFGADDAKRARHLANRCRLERSCFEVGRSPTASNIFKNVAFRLPSCGDCIIGALVTKSGALGLSAFLPDLERRFPARSSEPNMEASPSGVARLPMGRNWETRDFTLSGVRVGNHEGGEDSGISVREWVTRAIYRYRFAIGATKAAFVRLETPIQANGALNRVDGLDGEEDDPALVCMNDDVRWQPDVVKEALQSWMRKKWSRPAAWEVFQQ
ncbi:hypothetical protein FRB97_001850 [Tulasnella sp. 331]|nr:hypothetical protein FRB97_001850 [Tulasnella sp. 331]